MHAAQQIPKDVEIPVFITIDPISPQFCPINTMVMLLSDRITQIFGNSSTSPSQELGCQQFPAEFDEAARAQIQTRVGWWQNYYQSDLFSVLRSAPVNNACNVGVTHTDLKSMINGHIAMGMYPKLWEDISAVLHQQAPLSCTPKNI